MIKVDFGSLYYYKSTFIIFLTFCKQNNWISHKIVYSKGIINVEGYENGR